MEEEYKDIPGYEGMYQVSNYGNVKSLERYQCNGKNNRLIKEKNLKLIINKYGYLCVNLYKNTKLYNYNIHKLVCITFLNHIPNGNTIVVDHINGIKTDNRLDNLRLVTHRENLSFNNRKDFNKLTSKYVGVYYDNTHKKYKSSIRYNKNRFEFGYFENEIDASNKYQLALSHIEIGNFLEWFENGNK